MANFTTVAQATRTITQNVEYSIAKDANYSSGSPMTTLGYVQSVIDLSSLVAGDTVEIRVYKAVNAGTAAPVWGPDIAIGVQSQIYVTPLLLLASGWDVAVKLTSSTSRSIKFETLVDTNDVNAATVGAAAVASIWASISEGSETAAHALRLIRSRLLGKATIQDGDGAYTYRDASDTKNRIVMNRTGTARTTSTADGT